MTKDPGRHRCTPAHDRLTVPPRLLFINSGSPKKRLTFDAATRLGLQIYLINPEPDWSVEYAHRSIYTQGRSLPEIVAIAEQLHRAEPLQGVVTFWEEDVPTCALVARRLRLPGNSFSAAFNARSKFRMRQALQRGGVPVPDFCQVDSPESLQRACARVGLPAILKPEWGADSEWVVRIDSVQQALDILTDFSRRVRVQDCIYPYKTGKFVLEGLLEGPEVSVEGVVQHGTVSLYAIIDKAKMDDASFIERGECTPSRLPAATQEAIKAMVCQGVKALGLTHSGIHAEVKITRAGPRIVEIGARMGGDCIHALVKRVYGIDLAEENIRVALNQPVHPPAAAHGCGISRTLVPERPGRVYLQAVNPHKPLRRSPHLIEVVLTKNSGDAVMVPPEGYDNLAWISVWGCNYRDAEKRLETRARRLESAFVIQSEELTVGAAACSSPSF